MASRQRFLGDLDAATDKQFASHFVASDILEAIKSDTYSDIVYGSKGVGKTALRRALTELYRTEFYLTKTIDLDSISFSQVHSALSKLHDTSQVEVPRLASNAWRNVLAIYCLEAFEEQAESRDALTSKIREWLIEEGIAERDSNYQLMGFIEKILVRIGDVATTDGSTPLGLSADQRLLLDQFPYDAEMGHLLMLVAERMKSSGKKGLVCIDGFDSIVDHTPGSRSAIFAGLVDAIQKNSKDESLSSCFCFKAFLPQELTSTAHMKLWDSDKFLLNTHYARWSESEIRNFVMTRLRPFAKGKRNSEDFQDIWNEIFPDKVRNTTYKLDESAFDYIVRHTLYRPRQILIHLQKILDRWDQNPGAYRVDKSFVPGVVAETNVALSESAVSQLSVKHHGIDSFLHSWGGAGNAIKFSTFRRRLMRHFDLAQSGSIDSIVDELYALGIFGIAQDSDKASNSLQCRFGFIGGGLAAYKIHASISGEDVVALSPMFNEYCGCTPSNYGPVIPVER